MVDPAPGRAPGRLHVLALSGRPLHSAARGEGPARSEPPLFPPVLLPAPRGDRPAPLARHRGQPSNPGHRPGVSWLLAPRPTCFRRTHPSHQPVLAAGPRAAFPSGGAPPDFRRRRANEDEGGLLAIMKRGPGAPDKMRNANQLRPRRRPWPTRRQDRSLNQFKAQARTGARSRGLSGRETPRQAGPPPRPPPDARNGQERRRVAPRRRGTRSTKAESPAAHGGLDLGGAPPSHSPPRHRRPDHRRHRGGRPAINGAVLGASAAPPSCPTAAETASRATPSTPRARPREIATAAPAPPADHRPRGQRSPVTGATAPPHPQPHIKENCRHVPKASGGGRSSSSAARHPRPQRSSREEEGHGHRDVTQHDHPAAPRGVLFMDTPRPLLRQGMLFAGGRGPRGFEAGMGPHGRGRIARRRAALGPRPKSPRAASARGLMILEVSGQSRY